MGLVDKFEYKKELELRDHLAIERTRLANERTLFSYVRTSLYLLTGGISLLQIESVWHLRWLGWVCMVLSITTGGLGIVRFLLMRKHLMSYIRESGE